MGDQINTKNETNSYQVVLNKLKEVTVEAEKFVITAATVNLPLAMAKSISVILTQPVYVSMRYRQAHPEYSPLVALEEIRRENGFRGFFNGMLASANKEITKNILYKGITITTAPKVAEYSVTQIQRRYQDFAPSPQYYLAKVMMAAGLAASVEATLGGVQENWATYSAFARGFWREAWHQPSWGKTTQFLFKGAGANWWKNFGNYTVYFGVKDPIRKNVAALYEANDPKKMPLMGQFTAAFLVGSAMALIAPIDTLKTHIQKPKGSNESVRQLFKNTHDKHGWKGLFAGVEYKMALMVWGWMITNFVTESEHVERLSIGVKNSLFGSSASSPRNEESVIAANNLKEDDKPRRRN